MFLFFQLEKSVGDDIKVMVHNKHTTDIIATGGQENDLKLWQLKNMDKPIFTAKNVWFVIFSYWLFCVIFGIPCNSSEPIQGNQQGWKSWKYRLF